MGFDQIYRSAMKVCERLGTWVLYAVRDARDLEHLIGYMTYTVDDLELAKTRTDSAEKRLHLSKLIGYWRRAVRWVSGLDRENYAVIAERLIEAQEKHPEHRKLPFVVRDSGHRSLTLRDRPPRRAGRPRTRESKPGKLKECPRCNGLGLVAQDAGT